MLLRRSLQTLGPRLLPQVLPAAACTGQRGVHTEEADLRKAFAYCVDQVRKCDYEHYLCTLHLPRAVQPAAFAFRALNVEVATIPESTREINLAFIRMEWWREALEDLIKGRPPREHPVLRALSSVLQQHRVTHGWLQRLLRARLEDMELTAPPASISSLESFGEATASALLYLTLEAWGVRASAADHAASHAGKAGALARLLRSTPHHAMARRTYLPMEVLAKHKLSQEDLYRLERPEAVADAVLEVASAAKAHLEKARSLRESMPTAARPVLLPVVSTDLYLTQLERCGFDVFSPDLARGIGGVTHLWLQLQLQWHANRGTF